MHSLTVVFVKDPIIKDRDISFFGENSFLFLKCFVDFIVVCLYQVASLSIYVIAVFNYQNFDSHKQE